MANLAPLEPCRFPSLQDSAVALRVSNKTFGVESMKIPSISGSLPFSQLVKRGTVRTTSTTLLRGNLIMISTKDLPSSLNSACLLLNLSIHTSVRFSHTSRFNYNPSPLPETRGQQYISLRGQKLQVITKIVDYELQPEQSHEGVWHVEGMSHEEKLS